MTYTAEEFAEESNLLTTVFKSFGVDKTDITVLMAAIQAFNNSINKITDWVTPSSFVNFVTGESTDGIIEKIEQGLELCRKAMSKTEQMILWAVQDIEDKLQEIRLKLFEGLAKIKETIGAETFSRCLAL